MEAIGASYLSLLFHQSKQPAKTSPFSGYVDILGPTIFELVDKPESEFPTSVSAVVSNGNSVTASIADDGRIVGLRFGGPSGLDQIEYLTGAGQRKAPLWMAIGTAIETDGGQLVWLDESMVISQQYLNDSDTLQTLFKVSESLQIEQLDFASVDQQAIVRTWSFSSLSPSPFKARVYSYANLAPVSWRQRYLPVTDWLFDLFAGGFASSVLIDGLAAVNFQPDDSFGPLVNFISSYCTEDALNCSKRFDPDELYPGRGGGSYIGVAALSQGSSLWTVPVTNGLASHVPDLHAQASMQTFGRSAIVAQSDWISSTKASFSVALIGGSNASTCVEIAESIQSSSIPILMNESIEDWQSWLSNVQLPPGITDERLLAVLRAGFLATRASLAPQTGLLVASVNAEVPYSFDWPRDGAFIIHALLRAGLVDVATSHGIFYARAQRTEGIFAGTWAMNFAIDDRSGKIIPGGPIPLELDQVGCVLWAWGALASHLRGGERESFLSGISSALQRSHEFILKWKDKNGLPLPGNNDDNPVLSEGCQDAIAILFGLNSTLTLASSSLQPLLRTRQEELRAAIIKHFNDTEGFCLSQVSMQHNTLRPATWALFPGQLFPLTSPEAIRQGGAIWTKISPFLDGVPGTYRYLSEQLFALSNQLLAFEARNQTPPVSRGQLTSFLTHLAYNVTTRGTLHFSEVYQCQEDYKCHPINDVPHVYESMLTFLVADRLFKH